MSHKNRLHRGATDNKILLLAVGLVLIGLSYWVDQQPWKEPEMFKSLGLDLAKTCANVGWFLIWIQIIKQYFYVPLKEAMDERNSELEKTFEEAESLRTRMASMKSEYEQRLAATEASAREQIQAQIRDAQDLRSRLMSEASAQADQYMEKARVEIEVEKQKALSEIRGEVVNLTMKASEKLVGETMDNDRNRRLVDEFLTAEVAR